MDEEPVTRISLSEVFAEVREIKQMVLLLVNGRLEARITRLERWAALAIGGGTVVGFLIGRVAQHALKF